MPKPSTTLAAFSLATAFVLSAGAFAVESQSSVGADGIVKVKSAYPFAETIKRIEADIAAKNIKHFINVDQSKLAADAGITLRPSTLIIFGNPPLGTQFITSNPLAGLDWPVRLLVSQDDDGQVFAAYSDFTWIAHRHAITDRDAQFKMATQVIASITSSVTAK
jgi:uncharacterized protein (DUF302 family)